MPPRIVRRIPNDRSFSIGIALCFAARRTEHMCFCEFELWTSIRRRKKKPFLIQSDSRRAPKCNYLRCRFSIDRALISSATNLNELKVVVVVAAIVVSGHSFNQNQHDLYEFQIPLDSLIIRFGKFSCGSQSVLECGGRIACGCLYSNFVTWSFRLTRKS